nr:restriction endonuclease subunit S [Psychromonas antarctica]
MGWEVKDLSNLLEVKYGKDHKKLDDGKYPVYGSGGLMRKAEKYLYEGESVLIPRKGTLTNIMYVNEPFWTVDTMFYTIPKLQNVAKFSFYHLKTLDFTMMNVGSAVPSMTTKVLNSLQVISPTSELLQKFDAIISTYHAGIQQRAIQNIELTKLRDTLLPKLISGELQIPATEPRSHAPRGNA